jgi:hypothetical protein
LGLNSRLVFFRNELSDVSARRGERSLPPWCATGARFSLCGCKQAHAT